MAEVPASTVRRWIAEGKLAKHGRHRPYKVDLNKVNELADTLKPGPKAGPKRPPV
jgi:transposase